MSKKMFEFDSNMFHNFKDHFFKVNATNVIDDGLSLMNNQDGEPRFAFY